MTDNEKWDYAINTGGFYFMHAKYLELQPPSKECVDAFEKEYGTLTDIEEKLVIEYHADFINVA